MRKIFLLKLILSFVILNNQNLVASDFMASSLTMPEDAPVKLLGNGTAKVSVDRNCETGNEIISSETPNSQTKKLDHQNAKCQLHLGWGHSGNSKNYLKDINATGIGMGCNSGNAGVGDLVKDNHWWRFQRGPNGSYDMANYQGTQNGGLAPVIFDTDDFGRSEKQVILKNSFVGFMRLTQYHWLKLHEYAQTQLLTSECENVKISFDCVDGTSKKFKDDSWQDLDDVEYKKRISAWKNPIKFSTAELNEKYKIELEILNRFKPLENCFAGELKEDSLPPSCDQEVIISTKEKMASHCEKWVKEIDKIPQQSWSTDKALPRPAKYSYPAKGDLN
jgi:hypothetical protein